MRIPLTLALLLAVFPAGAEEVGRIGTDWTGNDVVVEAVHDPGVEGVTCHLTFFDRGIIDRLRQGNWFENPSNTSIACRQTAPIVVGDIDLDKNGEEIFSDRQSLLFKSIAVRRIYDRKNRTLIYVSFAREITEASAKMAVSTVPLHGRDVSWKGRQPD